MIIFALVAALLPFTAPAATVVDGDTLKVVHNGQTERVRLNGIDAPEKKQPFGAEAGAQLSALIGARPLTIFPTGRDRYGRTLAWVFVGKTSVCAAMVQDGAAWWFVRYSPRNSRLSELETSARAANLGLWALPHPVAPWDWRKGAR